MASVTIRMLGAQTPAQQKYTHLGVSVLHGEVQQGHGQYGNQDTKVAKSSTHLLTKDHTTCKLSAVHRGLMSCGHKEPLSISPPLSISISSLWVSHSLSSLLWIWVLNCVQFGKRKQLQQQQKSNNNLWWRQYLTLPTYVVCPAFQNQNLLLSLLHFHKEICLVVHNHMYTLNTTVTNNSSTHTQTHTHTHIPSCYTCTHQSPHPPSHLSKPHIAQDKRYIQTIQKNESYKYIL